MASKKKTTAMAESSNGAESKQTTIGDLSNQNQQMVKEFNEKLIANNTAHAALQKLRTRGIKMAKKLDKLPPGDERDALKEEFDTCVADGDAACEEICDAQRIIIEDAMKIIRASETFYTSILVEKDKKITELGGDPNEPVAKTDQPSQPKKTKPLTIAKPKSTPKPTPKVEVVDEDEEAVDE